MRAWVPTAREGPGIALAFAVGFSAFLPVFLLKSAVGVGYGWWKTGRGKGRSGVVTLENHTIVGGLGSAVAEMIAEAGLARRLLRLGLRDCYAHGASRRYLMRENGLDAAALVAAVEELTQNCFFVTEEELDAVELPVFQSPDDAAPVLEGDAKAEDL